MNTKKKTLAGRILRSIGTGIIHGIPFVSSVAADIREHRAARAPATMAEDVLSEEIPALRTATAWATAFALISSILSGNVDCDALNRLLQIVGLG